MSAEEVPAEEALRRRCIADTSLLNNFVHSGSAHLLNRLLEGPVHLSPAVLDPQETLLPRFPRVAALLRVPQDAPPGERVRPGALQKDRPVRPILCPGFRGAVGARRANGGGACLGKPLPQQGNQRRGAPKMSGDSPLPDKVGGGRGGDRRYSGDKGMDFPHRRSSIGRLGRLPLPAHPGAQDVPPPTERRRARLHILRRRSRSL